MSIDPGFLQRDPVSAFLDRDPLVREDPTEAFLAAGPQFAPAPDEDTSRGIARVAIGIGAAYLLYRTLMRDRMPERAPQNAQIASGQAWRLVRPLWLKASIPALLEAYRLGNTASLTPNELTRLAQGYAETLGDYIHESSTEALVKGIDQQLAQGWSERVAWERAREGFGLDVGQMRSYLTGILRANSPQGVVATIIPEASRAAVRTATLIRAERLGDAEAWAAMESARALGWLYLEKRGDLRGAQKRWITAEDERVCPICAPLHGATIPLEDRFESGGQRFFAPGVHPNCRCRLELVQDLPRTVYKAWTKDGRWDPIKRNADGEFASRESRPQRQRVQVMERPAEVELDQTPAVDLSALQALLSDAAERIEQAKDAAPVIGRSDAAPSLGAAPVIAAAPVLGQMAEAPRLAGAPVIEAKAPKLGGAPLFGGEPPVVGDKPKPGWKRPPDGNYWAPLATEEMFRNFNEFGDWISPTDLKRDTLDSQWHVEDPEEPLRQSEFEAAFAVLDKYGRDRHADIADLERMRARVEERTDEFLKAEARRLKRISEVLSKYGADPERLDRFAMEYAKIAEGTPASDPPRGPLSSQLTNEFVTLGTALDQLASILPDHPEFAEGVDQARTISDDTIALSDRLGVDLGVGGDDEQADLLREELVELDYEYTFGAAHASSWEKETRHERELLDDVVNRVIDIAIFPKGVAQIESDEDRTFRGHYQVGQSVVVHWSNGMVPESLRTLIPEVITSQSDRDNLMVRLWTMYPDGLLTRLFSSDS